MVDDYLEGIRETWVASSKVAKDLGQIKDYAVYVSDLPNSGDFNIVLVNVFEKGEDMMPSKARYDAFMEAWGKANEGRVREISKNYPAMREITGEYTMRRVIFK